MNQHFMSTVHATIIAIGVTPSQNKISSTLIIFREVEMSKSFFKFKPDNIHINTQIICDHFTVTKIEITCKNSNALH